jgi:hypothetical protein
VVERGIRNAQVGGSNPLAGSQYSRQTKKANHQKELTKGEKMMDNISEPVGLALLVCDYVITEKNTNKKSLVGLFTNITGQQFPMQFRTFWVYTSLTNLMGRHSFSLNIYSEATKANIGSISGNINVKDKNNVAELAVPVKSVTFPEPGKYVLSVAIDGQNIMDRILNIAQRKSEEKK